MENSCSVSRTNDLSKKQKGFKINFEMMVYNKTDQSMLFKIYTDPKITEVIVKYPFSGFLPVSKNKPMFLLH